MSYSESSLALQRHKAQLVSAIASRMMALQRFVKKQSLWGVSRMYNAHLLWNSRALDLNFQNEMRMRK